MSFGVGLVVLTAYWTLLIGGKALAQKGLAEPVLCMHFSNVLIGLIGLVLYRRVIKN